MQDMQNSSNVVSKVETPALSRKSAAFSDFLRDERAKQGVIREQHRAELHNVANTTHARIRAWEELHGLRLPLDPSHPIVLAIAVAVGIPVALIRNEQVARAATVVGPPSPVALS